MAWKSRFVLDRVWCEYDLIAHGGAKPGRDPSVSSV